MRDLQRCGSACAWRRRLGICIASAAVPLLAVGGRANAWRWRPHPCLASAAIPIFGFDGCIYAWHQQPHLCLASAAVPVLCVSGCTCPWRHRPRRSLALMTAPLICVGGRACTWPQRPCWRLWCRRTCLYLASCASCVGCHTYDWRWQPHHSLASTAAPLLGIDGRGSPFLRRPHLCLAWAAARLSSA